MIVKNSVIFISFELINKAIPFLLLPILTRYLTPDDYGVIASFTALVSFLAIFIGLSGHGAIDANFFRLEKNRLGIYIANVLIVLLLTTFLSLLFVFVFTDIIESKLAISFEWQVLAVIVALGQFITLINFISMGNRTKTIAIWNISIFTDYFNYGNFYYIDCWLFLQLGRTASWYCNRNFSIVFCIFNCTLQKRIYEHKNR